MGKLNFCPKCGSMKVEEAKAQLEELLEKSIIIPTQCGLCDKTITVASETENQDVITKIKQELDDSEDESCNNVDGETQPRTKKTTVVSKVANTNLDEIPRSEDPVTDDQVDSDDSTVGNEPVSETPVQSQAQRKMALRKRKRPPGKFVETDDSGLNVKVGEGKSEKIGSPSKSGVKSNKKAKIAVVSTSPRTRYPRTRKSIYSVPVVSSVDGKGDSEFIEIPLNSVNRKGLRASAGTNDDEDEDVSFNEDGDDEVADDDEDGNDDDFDPDDDIDETVKTEGKQGKKEIKPKRGQLIKSMLSPDMLALFTEETRQDDQSYAQCKLCHQNFYNMKAFTAHLAESHKEVEEITHPYQCSTCHEPFQLARSLKHHLEKEHKRIATCTICKKSSAAKNWLAKHMLTHQPRERKFECAECKMKFKCNKDLKRHLMIHTGERPYSCDLCQKSFMRPDDLKCHINLHKGIFFHCTFCPLKTHRERTLRQHILRQHSGEKKPPVRNHPCDHCEKAFLTNSALQRHLKAIHKIDNKKKKDDVEDEEEKSMRGFQGSIVKSLLHSDVFELITDQSKQDETNTAQCKLCELNFFTVKTFLKHLESEHDQKIVDPYQCQHCQERFTLVAQLKIHTEKNHEEATNPNKEKIVKSLLGKDVLDLVTEPSENDESDTNTVQCKFCESKFSTLSDFLQHMESEHDKQITEPYQCSECNKQFPNAAPLKKHIQNKHVKPTGDKGTIIISLLFPEYSDFLTDTSKQDGTNIAECKFCQQRFLTLTTFKNHMESEHDKTITEPYQCLHCLERFELAKPLKIHIQRKHKEVQTCTLCGKFSKQKNWLKKHMDIHSRNSEESLERDNHGRLKKFKCPELYCFYACARKRDMDRHILTHTGEKPHICEQCGKAFRRVEELHQHLRFHRGEFFYCSLCPLKTTSVRTLRAHVKRQHTDTEKKPVVKNVLCDICGHAFSNESIMRRHKLQTHVKDVIHFCKECDYKTHIAGSLTTHVKNVHLKIRNHKCLHCDAAFFDKKGLVWHTRRHTGEKPHQCKYCGKLFKRPDGLRYHLRLHEADYKYECDICGFSTIRTQMLLRHKERKHPETPRHVCTKCNMTFTTPQAVIAHNRQHKAGVEFVTKKPHQCYECDYSTDQPKSLRKHIERCHENDPNYECGYCHKKFHTEDQCKTHVRNYHEKYFLATFIDEKVANVSQMEAAVKVEPTSFVTETTDDIGAALAPLLAATDEMHADTPTTTTTTHDLSAALAPLLAATEEMHADTPTTTTIAITVNSDESVSLDSGSIRVATEEENAVAAAVLGLLPTGYGTEQLPVAVTSEVEETMEVISEVPSEVSVQVISEVPSEVPTQEISEVPSEVPTQAISEVPSAVPIEVISEITSEVPSHVTSKVTSELPTEVRSHVSSVVTTEVVPQVTSEVTTEVASQITAEVTTALLALDETSRVTVTEGN